MRIGLYGGSFDPVHRGHLQLIQQVLDSGFIDRLVVMPVGNPPHKSRHLIDARLRLKWLRKATQPFPADRLEVSDWEIRRTEQTGARSFTYDTLEYLQTRFPDAELVLIVGSDMLLDLPHWYRSAEIRALARILWVPRQGIDIDSALLPFQPDYRLATAPPEISSTDIRQKIAEQKPLKDWVPDCLIDDLIQYYEQKTGTDASSQ